MNNMHMMHGPTPYAGGVPSIQNQGTGMTAEGGRKKALICGCNYRCAMGVSWASLSMLWS